MALTDIALLWIVGWIPIYLIFWMKDHRGQNLWYIAPWVNIFYTALGYQVFGNEPVVHVLLFIMFYLMIKTYTSDNSLTNSDDYTG